MNDVLTKLLACLLVGALFAGMLTIFGVALLEMLTAALPVIINYAQTATLSLTHLVFLGAWAIISVILWVCD